MKKVVKKQKLDEQPHSYMPKDDSDSKRKVLERKAKQYDTLTNNLAGLAMVVVLMLIGAGIGATINEHTTSFRVSEYQVAKALCFCQENRAGVAHLDASKNLMLSVTCLGGAVNEDVSKLPFTTYGGECQR